MRQRALATIVTAGVMLVGSLVYAQAASLPPPSKMCALITERISNVTKWTRDGNGYFCNSTGMINPTGPDSTGSIYMFNFQASGLKTQQANSFHFRIQMYDSVLRKDQVAEPIVSHLTSIFAASGAGPVPNGLLQAINDEADASVPTALGTVATRFAAGDNAAMPYNGAQFDVWLTTP